MSPENKKKIIFKKKNIKIIKIKALNNVNDFRLLFKEIFKIGNGRILVETGLSFLNKLLKFKMINDLYIFKSKKNLNKNGYNNCNNYYIKRLKFKITFRRTLNSTIQTIDIIIVCLFKHLSNLRCCVSNAYN